MLFFEQRVQFPKHEHLLGAVLVRKVTVFVTVALLRTFLRRLQAFCRLFGLERKVLFFQY